MDPAEVERVRSIATKIRQSTVPNKAIYFSSTFSNFKTRYPLLYDMVCSDRCDDSMLNYMLSMVEKISEGNKTSDDASVDVGQALFDRYVGSVVDVEKLKRRD
jgi:hypothetical protein